MHIVLAIDECSDSDGSSEFLGGMVECMMKHGLGDAYLIVLYIEEEREEYLLSNSSMRDACVSCPWEPV